MSTEVNKKIIKRFYEELWNKRQLDSADEIFAENCVTHQLRSGEPDEGMPRGPGEMRQHVSQWIAAFPDLRFEVDRMVAEGDLVMTCSLMRGTHRGVWAGIRPTGSKVEIRMCVTHRIADGRIAEDWVLVEALGFFQQIDLLPDTEKILGGR